MKTETHSAFTGITSHRSQSIRLFGGRIAMISTHGYVAATPPLGAADTGGQVVYVIELSRQLARLGWKVDIWTRRFENQPEREPVCAGVQILRAPCGGDAFIPKEYIHESLDEWNEAALAIIHREGLQYDFINSHYWDAGIAGRTLAAQLAIPHLHTPHSLGIWKERQMRTDFPHDAARFDSLYNFAVRNREETALFRDADAVIATTPVQTEMLADDYGVPLGKIPLVSPGFDEERFTPVAPAARAALRQRFGFEGKTVLSLGRLARNKGYDLLIRAFPEVLARVPDARLHLAVGGAELSDRERAVLAECRAEARRLGLGEKVVFSGHVADAELADIYRAADVFVMPSRYEPFGMTAAEALACGTPVVATTHGGFWRTLDYGVNGLFADPLDTPDLAVTISKPLLYPDFAARMGRTGARHARENLTWARAARQLLDAAPAAPAIAA